MNLHRQKFKKWLIDDIKINSNASYSEILDFIKSFEHSHEFQECYEKWCKIFLNEINPKSHGPKHVREILQRVINLPCTG